MGCTITAVLHSGVLIPPWSHIVLRERGFSVSNASHSQEKAAKSEQERKEKELQRRMAEQKEQEMLERALKEKESEIALKNRFIFEID